MKDKRIDERRRDGRGMNVVAGVFVLMLAGVICTVGSDVPPNGKARGSTSAEPTAVSGTRAADADLIARGKALFASNCSVCHGEQGDGVGRFAYLMHPRPRNLRQGNFILAMTENQIPTDEDLALTIRNGMPGSAMPPWPHLPDGDIDALVAYVRQLHHEGVQSALQGWASEGIISEGEVPSLLAARTQPGKVIVPPPEPAFDESRWFRGQRLYRENCASCHGVSGEPVAEEVKFDAEGYPVPPRSFVQGIFKGGSDGDQLYVRLLKGMRGTPMPASEGIYTGDEIWDIVHYVQSLSRVGAQERARLKSGRLTAHRKETLPTSPTDPAWEDVSPLYVSLTPLWWSEQRVEGVLVQAVHNGAEVAMRLQWLDPTRDDSAIGQWEFGDAAAVQFSLTDDPPFFMGEFLENRGVNLWMWKADRHRNLAEGYRDEDAFFPDRVVDMYQEESYRFMDMTVVEWPDQPITAHNPLFVTAWAAGNLVADPTMTTPVECLIAQGPGTITGKPPAMQAAQGQGEYERGLWAVQFQRPMSCPHGHGPDGEVVFVPGASIPVSFAIWDGATGDRGGKKNISTWQTLVIE